MLIIDSLATVSNYPVSREMLEGICIRRGLDGNADADASVFDLAEYRLAVADLYSFLSTAPDLSQGGQSISFDAESRLEFKRRAMAIYAEMEENQKKTIYGYKGSRL